MFTLIESIAQQAATRERGDSQASSLTQRAARAVLLKLPVELVHRVWGFVLQGQNSFVKLNAALLCVPELSWSIIIVTDNVDRCASVYTTARVLSISEHELELRSRPGPNRLTRRVFVAFHCHVAVLQGELTAYEGSRYARLFFSPFIDASYCLLPDHEGRDRNYTEELLLRLQTLESYSSRKLYIVNYALTTDKLDPFTEIEISRGESQESTTTLRHTPTGKILDYRVSFSRRCTVINCPHTDYCSDPMVILNYEQLAPQVHISFKGSKLPQVHFNSNFGIHQLEELESYQDTTFSIANLNWSLSTPQGATVCRHGLSRGLYDQDSYNLLGSNCAPNSFNLTRFYKRIWYYGTPFNIFSESSHTNLSCAEELVWFRLSPMQLMYRRYARWWVRAPWLKRLTIFSELRESHQDYWSIPRFSGSKDMECVQLVALAKSDMPWVLGQVLDDEHLRSLESLELLQLRNSGTDVRDPRRPAGFVRMDWEQISLVASFVQQLTVGGYVPAFALPGDPLANNEAGVFRCLRNLCLDVSTLATSQDNSEDSWLELCLPETHFPRLSHLYLKGVFSMSEGPHSYPKITLTKTCTTLYLSSVIRTKAMVNGQLLEIPNTPVVANTFNSWLRCNATSAYVYSGAAYDKGFTRRIEEVEEALRPI